MLIPLFHRTLKKVRVKHGSLRQLAKELKIKAIRLSRLERGLVAPSQEERKCLAKYFPQQGHSLLHCPARPAAYYQQIRQRRIAVKTRVELFLPPADRPSFVRFKAAARTYNSLIHRLSQNLRGRGDYETMIFFLDQLSIGSSLECVFILGLLAKSAIPCFMALTEMPLHLPNPAVCPRTRNYIAHRPLPVLLLEEEIWIPQVSFSTPRVYTVDFLRFHEQEGWVAIEIDGAGHQSDHDLERSRALQIPVQRLNERQVVEYVSKSLELSGQK